jgi:hypothetical protein
MKEKLLFLLAGGIFLLVISFFLGGGVYTITTPNGPVDTAYMINRFSGKVWLIKTYSKQVGQVRVLSARLAEVEKTKELNADTELPIVAAQQEQPVSTNTATTRRRSR